MTYLKGNPLLRSRSSRSTSRTGCSATGGPAGPGVLLHAPEPGDQGPRPGRGVHGRPGHGAPGVLGPCYLEGSYSEVYPDCSEDEEGLLRLFKQFSFPGGIGSHCTPETPGSIHEGELGYVLSHACGAAFDNPSLIVAAVVGTASRTARWRRAGTSTSS